MWKDQYRNMLLRNVIMESNSNYDCLLKMHLLVIHYGNGFLRNFVLTCSINFSQVDYVHAVNEGNLLLTNLWETAELLITLY